jgi:mRNA-degrading endonuclease toxin of MazEF toxin-antitoxin module
MLLVAATASTVVVPTGPFDSSTVLWPATLTLVVVAVSSPSGELGIDPGGSMPVLVLWLMAINHSTSTSTMVVVTTIGDQLATQAGILLMLTIEILLVVGMYTSSLMAQKLHSVQLHSIVLHY